MLRIIVCGNMAADADGPEIMQAVFGAFPLIASILIFACTPYQQIGMICLKAGSFSACGLGMK